ncbi:MAG: hypothetical protein HY052_03005 [Proteobacteria bacterium]|nr:hypothetical protein [Pseudomonadota bacterium]
MRQSDHVSARIEQEYSSVVSRLKSGRLKGGYLVHTAFALAVLGGMSLYIIQSFGASPLDAVSAPAQQKAPKASADLSPNAPQAASSAADPLAWSSGPAAASKSESVPPSESALSPAPIAAASVVPMERTAAPPETGHTAKKIEEAHKETAAEGANLSSSDKIGTLEKRVTALEEAIAILKGKAVTREEIANLETSVGALQQRVAEEKELEKQAEKKGDNVAEVTPKKTKSKGGHKAKVHRHMRSASSVHWILKAAKPGMAWVVPKGSNDLRTVFTGDTLPGLGKITAIARDSSGRWVVHGTKGRIGQ